MTRPTTATEVPTLVAALRLMRPAQWPILTAQLLVSMLLAAPPLDHTWPEWLASLDGWSLDGWSLDGWALGMAWLTWVVLLNGGTLAFNSAYDRDTTPVAYLARPPLPPSWLARAALLAMGLGALLGTVLVGPAYGGVLAGCVVLSVLYSHPAVRLKSRPGWDLMVNMVGYGGATTLAGLLAITDGSPSFSGWMFTIGFSLLFGSFYPLTQIYQTADDRRRGDRTLTTALGIRPALWLALGLGLGAAAALIFGCVAGGRVAWLGLLIVALGLWCGHLVWWLRRAASWSDKNHERGMYRALALWATVDVALAVVWLAG